MKCLFLLTIILGCKENSKINDRNPERTIQKKELEIKEVKVKLKEKIKELEVVLESPVQKHIIARYDFNSNMKEMLEIITDFLPPLDSKDLEVENIFSLFNYEYNKCSFKQIIDIINKKQHLILALKNKVEDLLDGDQNSNLVRRIDTNITNADKFSRARINSRFITEIDNYDKEKFNIEELYKLKFINFFKFYDERLVNKNGKDLYDIALIYAIQLKNLRLVDILLEELLLLNSPSLNENIEYIENTSFSSIKYSSTTIIEYAKKVDPEMFCYLDLWNFKGEIYLLNLKMCASADYDVNIIRNSIAENIKKFNKAIIDINKIGLLNSIDNCYDSHKENNIEISSQVDLKYILFLSSYRKDVLQRIGAYSVIEKIEDKYITELRSIDEELDKILIDYISKNPLKNRENMINHLNLYKISSNLLQAILKGGVNIYYRNTNESKDIVDKRIILEKVLLIIDGYTKYERHEILPILIKLIQENNIDPLTQGLITSLTSVLKMANEEETIELIKAFSDKGFKFPTEKKRELLNNKRSLPEVYSFLEKKL